MKLEVLISTLNEGINNIENIFHDRKENLQYLINHQIWKFKVDAEIKNRLQRRDDVNVFVRYEKGLSKNRNQAIENASCEICLIADDDIELVDGAEKKILDAFYNNPDADIITFQIESSMRRMSKKYSQRAFWYNFKKLAHISSIEIAFKKSSIKDSGIFFDEVFGLGARYPIGEEFIFLTDAYRKGLKILYLPEVIVSHPHPSSGARLDDETIFARGAMFARVFGWKAFIVNFLFSIKKYTAYRKEISFFGYLTLLTKGTIDYFRSSAGRASCKS